MLDKDFLLKGFGIILSHVDVFFLKESHVDVVARHMTRFTVINH